MRLKNTMGSFRKGFGLILIHLLTITLTGCNFIPKLEDEIKTPAPKNEQREKPVFNDKGIQESLKGKWYYDNLTEEEQNIYNIIYNGLVNWEESIYLGGVPLETVKKIDSILMSEHPELFYASLSYGYTYYERDKNSVMDYRPKYCMTRDDYETKFAKVEAIANKLVEEVVKATKGEYEAELAIHDYLIDRVDYYTDDSIDSKEGLASFRTIYGALVEKKANCMGYAASMTYLLNKLNIQCGSMIGQATSSSGKTESHEWNFVNINDEWYYVDACWNDPNYEKEDEIDRGIRHGYFNVTSEEMMKTREFKSNLKERSEVPKAKSLKDNYYVRNGLVCETVDDYQAYVNENFALMYETGEFFEIKFPNKETYDYVYDNLSQIIQTAADTYNQSRIWDQDDTNIGEFHYTYIPDDRMQTIALLFGKDNMKLS